MAVRILVLIVGVLLLILALSRYPGTVSELLALCGLRQSNTNGLTGSLSLQLKLLLGVVIAASIVFVIDPDLRALLVAIDAVSVDIFLLLLAAQFRANAAAAGSLVLMRLRRRPFSLEILPDICSCIRLLRGSPGFAAQALALQIAWVVTWVTVSTRVVIHLAT